MSGRPESYSNFVKKIEERVDTLIEAGDRAECDKYGKALASLCATGESDPLLDGVLAGFRDKYRVRFAGTARPAAPVRDEDVKLIVQPVAAQTLAPMPEGTFTVEHADGSYETVRIETVKTGGLAGKRIASHISGPDNDNDFQGFAFVNDNRTLKVWSKKANIDERWVKAVQTVLLTGDTGEMAEAYAHRSGRCARCSRTLTVPVSLHHGYGPECLKKISGQMALA